MNDVSELLEKEPLLAFSVVTAIQVKALKDFSEEIPFLMEEAMNESGAIDAVLFNEIYTKVWLWVLGAYEVVRTMCQAETCFSSNLLDKLRPQKNKLARLRMPLSKQEYSGKREPSGGTAMFSFVDIFSKDIGFLIRGERFGVRQLLADFEILMDSIQLDDVLARHDSTY